MKKIILTLLIGISYLFAFPQEGAEHKITNIIGAGRVEINVGEQFNIKVGDVFQVFGKAQVIHPATGKLVNRNNVYLGKIKVIEVKELSSIAEQIEKKYSFSVGNKVVKVTSETLPVVEEKKKLEGQFENPRKRNYSETIYSHKEKKAKPNKDIHIIKIIDSDNQAIATIDKGNKTKVRGGKPVVNKKYYVFVPIVDTSSITGDQLVTGEEYIGNVKITSVEHDASTGTLTLKKAIEYSFIEKDNLLRTYIPKVKGFHHIINVNAASINFALGNKPISSFNGIYTMHGYMTSPYFFIGVGIGYNVEYFDDYAEAIIKNLPMFIHARFNILNRKTSPTFNLSVGKNIVLNKENENRLYTLNGGYFLSPGLGLKIYLDKSVALLLDVNYELKFYKFEYSNIDNYYVDFYPHDDIHTISFKIGVSF